MEPYLRCKKLSRPEGHQAGSGGALAWATPPWPLTGCLILHGVLTLERSRDYSLNSCLKSQKPCDSSIIPTTQLALTFTRCYLKYLH